MQFTIHVSIIEAYQDSKSIFLILSVTFQISFQLINPQGRAMTRWLFVCRSYRDGTGKLYGPWEMLRPLVSTFLLFFLMVVWARVSSCQVMELQPRLFYWTTGTAFSNIAVCILYRNIVHRS